MSPTIVNGVLLAGSWLEKYSTYKQVKFNP